jgi:hypothetical protein
VAKIYSFYNLKFIELGTLPTILSKVVPTPVRQSVPAAVGQADQTPLEVVDATSETRRLYQSQ